MHLSARAPYWQKRPGNWDSLNFSEVFSSEDGLGMPFIKAGASMPQHLLQWGSRPKLDAALEGTAVHFFLDDYRFESVWRNPARNLDALKHIGTMLSPDFSLWGDMPIAMQLWQVYRNRWMGRYWQERGLQVIPAISWSLPHDFCYAGVEVGSIVAISTVGVKQNKEAQHLFHQGFDRMCEVLQPSAILCYGSVAVETHIPVTIFHSRWEIFHEKEHTRKDKEVYLTEGVL